MRSKGKSHRCHRSHRRYRMVELPNEIVCGVEELSRPIPTDPGRTFLVGEPGPEVVLPHAKPFMIFDWRVVGSLQRESIRCFMCGCRCYGVDLAGAEALLARHLEKDH